MLAREFAGVFDVRQVFMVGNDGDWMGRSLNILMPFGESEDDYKQFSVIDVIVLFSGKKGAREVGTGMKVAIGITL